MLSSELNECCRLVYKLKPKIFNYKLLHLLVLPNCIDKEEDIRRLEAFEMWVWRRMEKISWRDMKTNEEVYYNWYKKEEILWI